MTKTLIALLSAAALITGCTASTDNMGAGSVDGADPAVCPDDMVLALEDYGMEELPTQSGAAEWLAANAGRSGVNSTDTGLQYKVVQAGLRNGLMPVRGDEIFANYHGFKPDGSVFDSSYERGKPLSGGATDWIKGWNEALAEMKVCEARTLYIPANLAYGDNGRVSGTLVFHMQLLRVNK